MRKDMIGERIGRLVVTEFAGLDKYKRCLWKCKCDCGNECVVFGGHLRQGHTTSCGCVQAENRNSLILKNTTHGESRKRLYNIWYRTIQKCENPSHCKYQYYGARGISVCKEWHDYATFAKWARANGYDESLTIDRINNDGNYEPSNCRWANMEVQSNNRRNNVLIAVDGVSHTMSEWSKIYEIPYKLLWSRLNSGWSFERAVKEGVHNAR